MFLFIQFVFFYSGFWVPGPAPVVREIGHLTLVLHEKLTASRHRLHFMITGSYLMSLKVRPKESVILESWNLTPRLPPETVFNKQKCYFVMITHGLEHEAINITMTLKVRILTAIAFYENIQ